MPKSSKTSKNNNSNSNLPSPDLSEGRTSEIEERDSQQQQTFVPFKLDKKILKDIESITTEENLDADLVECENAIHLFLNSRVAEATEIVKAKYGVTMTHTHGYAVISALKSILTCDAYDIALALDALKNSVEVASSLRKEQSIVSTFSSLVFGSSKKAKESHLRSLSRVQLHAEITFAEAYLIKAILFLLTDPNLVGFLREGLAIRQSYSIFKSCYKFLVAVYNSDGPSEFERLGIDVHFIQSIYMGMGAFNLILSTIPKQLLRLFEMIGFGGHRSFGLRCLEIGANWPAHKSLLDLSDSRKQNERKKKLKAVNFFALGNSKQGTRMFLCDLTLMLYHIALASMIQIPGCNMVLARTILEKQLQSKPDSFIYLILEAKSLQAQSKPKECMKTLEKVILFAKDWIQLAHICYFEMGICNLALGEFEAAAVLFGKLYEENKWSKATYLYLQAVCLYTVDPVKNAKQVGEMMAAVPKLCNKVAGKSIPIEKYVSRKSRKYFLQNERLLLPAYEIMYMWCGFDVMPRERVEVVQADFDKALKELDLMQKEHVSQTGKDDSIPYKTFYDDFCLARFLKGVASRELIIPNSELLLPEEDFVKRVVTKEQKTQLQYAIRQLEFISLQADSIDLDHWVLPFARYELGSLYVRLGDYEKARREYNAALNGGYSEDEVGQQKHKVSMEQSLHLRAHNALVKISFFEAYSNIESDEYKVFSEEELSDDEN